MSTLTQPMVVDEDVRRINTKTDFVLDSLIRESTNSKPNNGSNETETTVASNSKPEPFEGPSNDNLLR